MDHSCVGSTTRTLFSPLMLPSLCLTARRPSCLVFVKQGERFEALNFWATERASELGYTQGYTDSSRDQLEMLAEYVRKASSHSASASTVHPSMRCATGFPNRCMIAVYQALESLDRDKLSAPTAGGAWMETGRRRSFPATAPFTSWQWRFARAFSPERSSRPV